MFFHLFLAAVSFVAGGVASIAGFGIGSLVTPLLALKIGTSLAVAGVSVAHFSGTALRLFLLRKDINRRVLLSFGSASAAGGLLGALLHNTLYNTALTVILGFLLVFAGAAGLTGVSAKMRLSGPAAWLTGGLSGLFGGLVGNQGGIRSAALFGFRLQPKEFVATATGIALMVDIVRVPVYVSMQGAQMAGIRSLIGAAIIGVLLGTLIGGRLLRKIPERLFKKIVFAVILAVGIFMLAHR